MGDGGLHIGVDGRELVGQATGVGRYLHDVLQEWASTSDRRHEITVFVPAPPPAGLAGARGIQWHIDPARHAGTVWEQTRLPRAIRAAGVDVFFAAGYTAPVRLACPYVVAIYDVSFFAQPEGFGWREGLRRRWLTKHTVRRAASVVTISRFSADQIVRWLKVEPERIRLAPPGPPATAAAPATGSRDRLVLYVGTLLNRRHIPDLLQGFAVAQTRVPGARLVLVGANRTHPRLDVGALAARLGIAGRVDWRGYVSEAELDRLYSSARVFAFLSDYEGFAMTPMEALARGTPAVMLDTPVTREVYGDGARRVQATPDEIGESLALLLVDDAAHAAVLAAGQARLRDLSWGRTAATILRALEEAAGSR